MRRVALVTTGALFLAVACTADGDEESSRRDTPPAGAEGMVLESAAFDHDGSIPEKYTCDGSDVSPPLALSQIPADAVTLALVVDDPDAPGGVWDHWVEYDIPVVAEIPEAVATLGTTGVNSWGRSGYGGPCPPSGTHRYFFTIRALDTELGLEPGADKAEVLEALSGHVLAEATLVGRYAR